MLIKLINYLIDYLLLAPGVAKPHLLLHEASLPALRRVVPRHSVELLARRELGRGNERTSLWVPRESSRGVDIKRRIFGPQGRIFARQEQRLAGVEKQRVVAVVPEVRRPHVVNCIVEVPALVGIAVVDVGVGDPAPAKLARTLAGARPGSPLQAAG